MKFLPYETQKELLLGLYRRTKESVDLIRSEELYKSVRKIYDGEEFKILGKGKAIRHYLNNTQIFAYGADLFSDHFDKGDFTPVRLRKEDFSKYHKRRGEERRLENIGAIFARGDFGHTAPDWERIIKLGFLGIADEALERANSAEGKERAFYLSVNESYLGISELCVRLADAVSQASGANAQVCEANLRAIAAGAPKSLAEAMQLYFIYYAVQQHVDGAVLRSLGSLDEILFELYKKDIESGVSKQEICELVKYFLMKWNDMEILANIPFDLSSRANELSFIILEEYVKLRIPDPKIHIKCYPDMNESFVSLALDAVRSGVNSFVFVGDATVRSALERVGIDKNDSGSYTLIGCYEPAVIGKELPCTVNSKISLPKAIELALSELGGNTDISYEELSSLVWNKVEHFINIAVNEITEVEGKYKDFMAAPTLSGAMTPCMDNAKDAYEGGAKYNSSSLNCFGLATFVDSMSAIYGAVYVDKITTLEGLCAAINNNWAGEEELRLKMKYGYERYGRGDSFADELTKAAVDRLSLLCNGRENGRGGNFRLGLFSIDWIFEFGKKLGATPDGRFSGEAISKNLCATVGMDTEGVTALTVSALSFDHTKAPNGTVLDLAIHPTAVKGEDGLVALIGILKTYFSLGGFAVQMNIVDKQTLINAQNEPEKYKSLQVRLCGWNVYFNDLDREAQDNLIAAVAE